MVVCDIFFKGQSKNSETLFKIFELFKLLRDKWTRPTYMGGEEVWAKGGGAGRN